MNALHIVKPKPNHVLTIDELLSYLGPDKLDAIDRDAKIMREAYTCPFTVRDYEAFKSTLFAFFAHYQKTFFNFDIAQSPDGEEQIKHFAYDFVQRHISGAKGGMRAAERNAITGREGGMIAVIDELTEAIAKLHTETYIRSVFFDLIGTGDFDMRLRLAAELIKKYGPLLFPGEELLPYWTLGMNLEQFIQSFVSHIHALRREWRY